MVGLLFKKGIHLNLCVFILTHYKCVETYEVQLVRLYSLYKSLSFKTDYYIYESTSQMKKNVPSIILKAYKNKRKF